MLSYYAPRRWSSHQLRDAAASRKSPAPRGESKGDPSSPFMPRGAATADG